MVVSPDEAEMSMDGQFDDPEELTAPRTVTACVLSIMAEYIDGLLPRVDDQPGVLRRVGTFGQTSKDSTALAQYPKSVVSIR